MAEEHAPDQRRRDDGQVSTPLPSASASSVPGSLSSLSYEQARDQLADIVRRLEAGGLTLEESLALWERGERLVALCEEWLEGARARLAAVLGQRESTPDNESAPF